MLLELKNLTAGYGEAEVLKNLSLEIEKGEIVCLIGPNGAGKSTVLKSIMGLANKKFGLIIWKGIDITNLPTHALLKKGIGFVPQGRLVFPGMTVLENLEMGAYLLRSKAPSLDSPSRRGGQIANRLEKVFGHFPVLKLKAKIRAGALSGGEQQMLSISRALMMTPELLMLDEPSLGLAPKITNELFDKLKAINRGGTTLLIVEQNVRLVLKYASRGYLLSNGGIKFSGTAEELSNEKLMQEAYLT